METSIRAKLVPERDSLYLMFGGIHGGMGMPRFEFEHAAGMLDASKLWLRDMNQAWYQRGLPGIGNDIPSICRFLLDTIERSGATRIRFVGNSMGGFAALLFCALLRRGRAIAFVPQTFIGAELRAQHLDMRWRRQIAALHAHPDSTEILDLPSFIRRHYPLLEADVYVSTNDRLDLLHADMLSEFENIAIHRYDRGGHSLTRSLRDAGLLTRILAA